MINDEDISAFTFMLCIGILVFCAYPFVCFSIMFIILSTIGGVKIYKNIKKSIKRLFK